MDSASMNAVAEALAAEGIRVARFEFAYMAARRSGGSRKPPPRADRLTGEYLDAVRTLKQNGPLVIGGKSMGGRVASMVADELHQDGKIAGLICIGYPFHPPNKPDQLRTSHLEDLATPSLIFQGTRDPFGTADEVPSYSLSQAIELVWLEDGDHDLKPRKRISGLTISEWFTTEQDQIIINNSLRQCNHTRPHQALNMRPPVPETFLEKPMISGPGTGG